MSDVAKIASGLTKARREKLAAVCRTSGGGLRVRCRVRDDGYGEPTDSVFRWLYDNGLIQGKSGAFEMVVHTRDGWAVYQYIKQDQSDAR